MPTAPPAARPLAQPVIPVSLLVSSARLILERQLGLAWIAGEISGFTRAASGHCYFTLKDAHAQVRCVLFRQKSLGLSVALADGQAVEVRATPTIYEARGDFQLNVESVRLAGLGALYERFVRLKARLEQAGWFDAGRKRPLPLYPRGVGIVTSPHAAALRDVLTTLARRWPAVRAILYPAPVQGEGAAAQIAAAIALASARRDVDVLIVCRGGGSLEDLWSFNEEIVARALFESALPVVSGVGHETDFTICDFVADARAPTPTAAAALVVPDRAAFAHKIAQLVRHAERATAHALATRAQRVDHVARRLVHPAARLAAQRERAAALAARLAQAWSRRLAGERQDVAAMAARLLREVRTPLPQFARLERHAERWGRAARDGMARRLARVDGATRAFAHLNPHAVLTRGYAIVSTAAGDVVYDAAQLAQGDALTLALARGAAGAKVTDVEPG
ncbi:MAG: exodeoxyribonuclease VII large subunit [Casimicrobiaceae bacterium]